MEEALSLETLVRSTKMHGVTFKNSKILQFATVRNWTGTDIIITIIIIISFMQGIYTYIPDKLCP